MTARLWAAKATTIHLRKTGLVLYSENLVVCHFFAFPDSFRTSDVMNRWGSPDLPPRNSLDPVVEAEPVRAAGDDEAAAAGGGVFSNEGFQVADVAGRGVLGPFHFDWEDFVIHFEDEVDFCSVAGAIVGELSFSFVGNFSPELAADPVLEEAAGIGVRGGDGERQTGGGVAHSIVEQEKARARQGALARAAREGRHAETDEHVLEQFIVSFHQGGGDAGFAGYGGKVDNSS